jgi:hypothetical protein
MHRCLNNTIINNNASENNGPSGIYVGQYSRGNVLISNIAISNNNTDLFIVESESNTIVTEEPSSAEEIQINDSENETAPSPTRHVPFPASTLAIAVFLVAYLYRRTK